MESTEPSNRIDALGVLCRDLRRVAKRLTPTEAYAALVATLATFAREHDIDPDTVLQDVIRLAEAA